MQGSIDGRTGSSPSRSLHGWVRPTRRLRQVGVGRIITVYSVVEGPRHKGPDGGLGRSESGCKPQRALVSAPMPQMQLLTAPHVLVQLSPELPVLPPQAPTSPARPQLAPWGRKSSRWTHRVQAACAWRSCRQC